MIIITSPLINSLLNHAEPAIRYKTRVHIIGDDPSDPDLVNLREQIRSSPIVQRLLSERGPDGKIDQHPYKKWNGSHWILTHLAELEYPPNDNSLLPLRDQVYEWLSSDHHRQSIKSINGRVRRCASQESNALFSSLTLGLINEQTQRLVYDLLLWQWPDGGWNCDKHPEAHHSSFWETLTPLRALSTYKNMTHDPNVKAAVARAAEVFLKRYLFQSQSSGKVINQEFLELHYPIYWRYDILQALLVMSMAGFLNDLRSSEALDILESKQLPDGGFPAEGRFYQVTKPAKSIYSLVNWGGVSKNQKNPWVTINALIVLKNAGRLRIENS
jgi:hypothetical protein